MGRKNGFEFYYAANAFYFLCWKSPVAPDKLLISSLPLSLLSLQSRKLQNSIKMNNCILLFEFHLAGFPKALFTHKKPFSTNLLKMDTLRFIMPMILLFPFCGFSWNHRNTAAMNFRYNFHLSAKIKTFFSLEKIAADIITLSCRKVVLFPSEKKPTYITVWHFLKTM